MNIKYFSIAVLLLAGMLITAPVQARNWYDTWTDGDVIYASDFNTLTAVVYANFQKLAGIATNASSYNATYDAKTNYNASYWTGTNYNGSYLTSTFNGTYDAKPGSTFNTTYDGNAALITARGLPTYDALVYQNATYTIAVTRNGTILSSVLISAHTDDIPIQAAATPGGTVYVATGDYESTGAVDINLPSNTTISGSGSVLLTNIGFRTADDTKNINIYNFEFAGDPIGAVTIGGSTSVNVERCTATNLSVANGAHAFTVEPNGGGAGTASHITFRNCFVDRGGRTGFFLGGMTATSVIEYVNFYNCVAYRCGYTTRFNDWIAGFNLCEVAPTISHIHLYDCKAIESWKSGFHTEPGKITDLVFEHCEARGNGVKPDAAFGDGFGVQGDVSVIRSIAENNSRGGIVINSGALGPIDKIRVEGNSVINNNAYGIYVNNTNYIGIPNWDIHGNYINSTNISHVPLFLDPKYRPEGSPYKNVGNNIGFLSSNWGNVSLSDGGTVPHLLGGTPSWARCDQTLPGESCTVTELGATALTISIKNTSTHAAGTTQQIRWEARL